MKGAAAAVIEFNQNILGVEPRPLEPLPENEKAHLKKCLDEEATEFVEGVEKGDVVEAIDALMDSMYYALGGLYKMGLTAEQIETIFLIVHKKNMTKRKGVVEHRAVEGAVDAVKGENWVPAEVEIAKFLFETD
jgi:predicted HAD superfamily Cof-like phosphohydrolase